MTRDVVLWRMRHRTHGIEMVCQIVRNELVLSIEGDPIPVTDPRVRDVLKQLTQRAEGLPLLMQLAMRGWQMEHR